jgi:hypothetical protein
MMKIQLKSRSCSVFRYFLQDLRANIRANFIEISGNSDEKLKQNANILAFLMLKTPKRFDEILLKYWGLSGEKACTSCRFCQERSNEYLLAKIGVDTAENEPFKVHLIFKLWDLIFTEPPRPDGTLNGIPISRVFSAAYRRWVLSLRSREVILMQ